MRKWCEGEKVIPLKKRRGSFLLDQTTLVMEDQKDKKITNTKTIKTKTSNKKPCSTSSRKNDDFVGDNDHQQQYDQDQAQAQAQAHHSQQLGNNISGGSNGGSGGGKNSKKVRGGALMEGSRCSRVNGRGWRCCQQTLVGYSLCEHHLGKGRLRSMTSVRSRSLAKSTTVTTTTGRPLGDPLSSSSSVVALYEEKEKKSCVEDRDSIVNIEVDDDEDDEDDDDDDDDYYYGDHDNEKKKPLMIAKKRMKLGMVKARSISSLLGQTNSTTGAIPMADS